VPGAKGKDEAERGGRGGGVEGTARARKSSKSPRLVILSGMGDGDDEGSREEGRKEGRRKGNERKMNESNERQAVRR